MIYYEHGFPILVQLKGAGWEIPVVGVFAILILIVIIVVAIVLKKKEEKRTSIDLGQYQYVRNVTGVKQLIRQTHIVENKDRDRACDQSIDVNRTKL